MGQPQGQSLINLLTQEARANRLYAFGTSYIFQRRAATLKSRLNILNYIGIVLPLTVGAVALAFGADFALLPWVIAAAAVVLIGQLAVSLWSLIAGWVDGHAFANESVTANDDLVRRYDALLTSSLAADQFKIQYDLVRNDDHNRRNLDNRQKITEREKRAGMRAALRHYQQPCATCSQVPTSLTPTNCDTCGNY